MGMTTRILDRIMDGAKTPEGKIIAVLLALCLAFMCWNVSTINAFAGASDEGNEAVVDQEAQPGGSADSISPKGPTDVSAETVVGEVVEPEPEQQVEVAEPAPEQAPAGEEAQASGEAAEPEQPAEATADPSASAASPESSASSEAAQPAEDEKEEVKYPAVSFPEVTKNGVTVRVYAPEGAFPEGTEMRVTPIASGSVASAVSGAVDGEVSAVRAVDITFIYEGAEIEPRVPISVSLTSAVIARAEANDATDAVVVHIDNNSNASVVAQSDSSAAANEIAFTSGEFSVYAIVVVENEEEAVVVDDDATSYRLTYRFYLTDANGLTREYAVDGEPVVQIVKEGDTLIEPQVPEVAEHQEFSGWYVDGKPLEFGTIGDIPANLDVTVVGDIDTAYTVTLKNGKTEDASEYPTYTVVTAKAEKGQTTATANLGSAAAVSPNEDERFLGWSLSENATDIDYAQGASIELTEDITLYPVFGKAYWIYFDENDGGTGGGASYTAPEYVTYDESPTAPENPQRVGYRFTGWYTTPECTEPFDFSKAYNTATTVYAGWSATVTTYTVIYWQQKVTDSKDALDADKTYDYVDSIKREAVTGATVTPLTADTQKGYTGFHYNSSNSDDSAVVKADGSTILNVRYDRNLVSMTFDGIGEAEYKYTETTSTSSSYTYYGYIGGEYVQLTPKAITTYTYTYGSGKSKTTYNGTRYEKVSELTWNGWETYYYPTTSDSGTLYGYVNGEYKKLTRSSTTTYTYTYNDGNSVYGGVRYTRSSGTSQQTTYTGLYGQQLSTYGYEWPDDYAWKYGSGTGMTFLGEFILPDGENSISFSQNGSVNGTINFYLQNVDGTYNAVPSDRGYSRSATGNFNFTEKYNGFKVSAYQNNNVAGNTGTWTATHSGSSASYSSPLGIRYARQSYEIDFQNGAQGSIGSVERLYEQSLDGVVAPATPTFPGNPNEADAYEFVGWFADPECTTLVAFGSDLSDAEKAELAENWEIDAAHITVYDTMPANNLVVYAGWFKKWFRVTLDPNGGVLPQGQKESFWVQYGDTIKESSLSQTAFEGYKLLGWGEDSEDGTTWNFAAGVTGNTTLVAKWISDDSLQVLYETSSGTAPVDSETYVSGAHVVVGAAPEAPAGKVFAGWRLYNADGVTVEGTYYPGDSFKITPECIVKTDSVNYVKLVAAFVTYDVTTTIAFAANGGEGTIASQDMAVNSTVSAPETGFTKEGYTLIGWSTEKGANNDVMFDLGAQITADNVNEADNVLYAVWAHNVEITATGDTTQTYEYDGTQKTNTAATVTYRVEGQPVEQLPAGFGYTVEGEATGVATGTYNDNLVITVDGLGASHVMKVNGVNYYVTTAVENGSMEIVKPIVTVTVTGHSSTVVYDGEEHETTGFDVTADNAAFDVSTVSFSGTASAARTDAGTTQMGLEASQFSVDNDDFVVGRLVVVDGYQTVTPLPVAVTVTGNNVPVTYDGAEHAAEGYTLSIGNDKYPEEAINFSGQALATGTDAGTYPMNLTSEQFSNTNENFEVTFTVVDGKLVVSPVDEVVVTITGANETKTYNRESQTAEGYTFAASNQLYTEADFTFDGPTSVSRTNAGTTEMGLDSTQFHNTNTNFAKVTFDVTDGSIEITKAKATVTVTGDKPEAVTYDRAEHSASGYTVSAGDSVFDIEADLDATITSDQAVVTKVDAGTYPMGLNINQFANRNENIDVTFVINDGQLVINPITEVVFVDITGNTEVLSYNGQSQSVTGFTAAASNSLYVVEATDTQAADFTYTGKKVATGSAAGAYDMEIALGGFTNLNTNFTNVKFQLVRDGKLTIRPVNVTVGIAGNTASKTYNGSEQEVSDYTVESIDNALFTEDLIEFVGNANAAGTNAGTYYMNLKEEDFYSKDLTNFIVKFNLTDGSLTIDPITEAVTVTVTGNTGTYTYNGGEQAVSGYAIEASNPLYKVAGEGAFYTFTGSNTVTGTNAGNYNMNLASDQFSNNSANFSNVTFNVTDGSMTINPLDVIVTVQGATAVAPYDGNAHNASGFTLKANNALYDVNAEYAVYTGSAADRTATRTDAGTTNMDLEGKFRNDSANFNVTWNVVNGYTQVNPIPVNVTIVGDVKTNVYDGAEHTASGYTATADTSLYNVSTEGGDFTFNGTATASRTEVGTTNMGLAADQFANNNGNFEPVTFSVTDGSQTITADANPVVVTITGHSVSGNYTGEAYTATGYDVTSIKLNGEDTELYTAADFTFSGESATASRTEAGTSTMALSAADFTNNSDSYTNVEFMVVPGTVTVNAAPVTVTITGTIVQETYNGEAHTASGYTAVADNSLYNLEDTALATGATATVSQVNAGTYSMGLTADSFVNGNANFAVTYVVADGQLIVDPLAVSVTVKGATDSVVYDTAEHTTTGFTASADNGLYNVQTMMTLDGQTGDAAQAAASAARTEFGTTDMGLTASRFANTDNNFVVTFDVTDGYQGITKRNVTVDVTGATSVVPYDGESHTVQGYELATSDDFYSVGGVSASLASDDATATRTDAGTTIMGLSDAQFANADNNYNVTFNVTDGYQTIEPITLTVTIVGNHSVNTYDGDTHAVTEFTAEASNSLFDVNADMTFSGTASASRQDVGTTPMGLVSTQFDNTNKNFVDVVFNVTDGYQTIEPRPVHVAVTGETGSLVYNGATQQVTGKTYRISELDDGKNLFTQADVQFNGSDVAAGTTVGAYAMGLAAEQFVSKAGANYSVSFDVVDGSLTIVPMPLTVEVTGNSAAYMFNDAEQFVEGYTTRFLDKDNAETALYTADDFAFTGQARAAGTAVDTYSMGLAPEQFTNNNGNFDVRFKVIDGSLQIVPNDQVTVRIVGHKAIKTYNGEEQFISGYDIEIVAPEGVNYSASDIAFNGNARAAGTNAQQGENAYAMGLDRTQFANTNANFDNVTFAVEDGQLEITPLSVTVDVKGETDTLTYNGESQQVEGYTSESRNSLYNTGDFSFSGTASASRQDVGTEAMGLIPANFTNTNPNFNVVFSITDGSLVIVPLEVTVDVTGAKQSFTYNGEDQSVTGYETDASNELYSADNISFTGTNTATRQNVGKTNMGLAADQFANTNDNFDVTFDTNDGWIQINPRPVTVTIEGNTNSVFYNGEEQSVSDYNTEISDTLYTAADYTFSGEGVATGTNAGRYPMGLTASEFVNGNDNFAVAFKVTDGALEIKKLPVTVNVTGNTDSFMYNGTEQTVTGYEVETTSDLYTAADFTFDGAGAVGLENAGKSNMGLSDAQFTNTNDNFDVTFNVTDGWVEVTPASAVVNITGAVESGLYNGEDRIAMGYTVDIEDELGIYSANDIVFSGEAKAIQHDAGSVAMGLVPTQFVNANDNYTVTFNVTDGSSTVAKRNVVLTSASSSKAYDGTPLVTHGTDAITVSGDDFVPGESPEFYITGSQTAVGESENTFGYVRSEVLDANYNITKVYGMLTVTEPEPDTTPVEPEEQNYTLTVLYRYANGDEAAQMYRQSYAAGAEYLVESPRIDGYIANYGSLSGVMGSADLTLTVTYTSITPAGDDNEETRPNTDGIPAAQAGTTDATDNAGLTPDDAPAGVVTIDDNGNPLIEVVGDDSTPLAPGAGTGTGAWALLNLIATIVMVVLAVVMLVGMFGKRREDEDQDEAEYRSEEQDQEAQIKRHRIWRIAGIVLAVVAVIVELLTSDFMQPMVMIDKWTIVFAILLVVQLVTVFFSRKKTTDPDDEDQAPQAATATA